MEVLLEGTDSTSQLQQSLVLHLELELGRGAGFTRRRSRAAHHLHTILGGSLLSNGSGGGSAREGGNSEHVGRPSGLSGVAVLSGCLHRSRGEDGVVGATTEYWWWWRHSSNQRM